MELFDKMPEQVPAEMTKTAFAGHLGVTSGRISQMIADGLPVLPNGKVGVEAAEAWYRANVRHKTDGAKRQADKLTDLKVEREQAQRDLLRMEIERKRGALIDRKLVELAIFERARAERDAHIAWIQRTAAPLAAELGVDLNRLIAALDREMRQHLQELADTPLPELLRDA